MTAALISAGILAGGGILQSGINFGSSVYSSQKQFDYAKAMARYQYDLQMQALREQYTNARTGLEKAGYNPILALQNGVNTQMGLSQAAAVPVDNTNVLSSATNAAKLLGAEIQNIQAQTNKANQEALTESEKRLNLQSDSAFKNAQTVLTNKNSSWVDKVNASQVTRNYMESAAAVTGANAQQLNATVNADLSSLDKQRLEQYIKDHPIESKILYRVGQYTGAIGKVFSGNVGIKR